MIALQPIKDCYVHPRGLSRMTTLPLLGPHAGSFEQQRLSSSTWRVEWAAYYSKTLKAQLQLERTSKSVSRSRVSDAASQCGAVQIRTSIPVGLEVGGDVRRDYETFWQL